jgi:adenine phosphoribosyltransferase
MQNYSLKIAGIERTLPFVPISEELAYASFVVISDSELVSAVAPLIAERIHDCDLIMTAEAKGIALAHEVSKQLGLKRFAVARKSIKSYMKDPISVSVRSITTTSLQQLYLDGNDLKDLRGKRVCLLDDVVSTGGSLTALEALAEKAGAIVCARACILAEGEAADRDDLIFLQKLPLFKRNAEGGYEEIG